jgi:hypothetical protein
MPDQHSISTQRRAFSVYIVESPSALDMYHKRFEGEIISKSLSLIGIASTHRIAVSLDAFQAALTVGFQTHLKEMAALPFVVHISAHGTDDGVQLTDGSVIEWQTLRTMVSPINKSLEGALVLCMSSCGGFSACRMAMQDGELPFGGVIGSTGSPTWGDTTIAYSSFYHLLAKGRSLGEALEAMKTASGDPTFEGINAQTAQEIYLTSQRMISEQVRTLEESVGVPLERITAAPPDSSQVKRLQATVAVDAPDSGMLSGMKSITTSLQ